MATKTLRPKGTVYGQIQRGCSLTIPVVIKDILDIPFDLTDMKIAFTVKKTKSDFDRADARAYIQKLFSPQEAEQGRFFIMLTSKDTDFEPGDFFFDIEITHSVTGMVYRVCTLEFELIGGPTNRTINAGVGQLPLGDEITIISLEQGVPVVVIAPMLAFSPNTYAKIAELQDIIIEQTNEISAIKTELEDMKIRIEILES